MQNSNKSRKLSQKFHSLVSSPEKTRNKVKKNSLKTLKPLILSNIKETKENKEFHLSSRIKIFRTHTIADSSSTGSSANIPKVSLKTQRRIESLDFLLNKCSDAQSEFNNFEVLQGVKKINQGYGKLKKTVELFQDDCAEEELAQGVRIQGQRARRMKSFMRYDKKLKTQRSSVWKHEVNTFTRSMSKNVAAVASEINRKNGFF